MFFQEWQPHWAKVCTRLTDGDHMAFWEDVKIIDKERGWKERKIKEAAHIAMSTSCISQPSADLSPMWLPLPEKHSNPRI